MKQREYINRLCDLLELANMTDTDNRQGWEPRAMESEEFDLFDTALRRVVTGEQYQRYMSMFPERTALFEGVQS